MTKFENLINHRDISVKFIFKTFGEIVHNYWGLEGEYIGLVDSEAITFFGC